LHFRERRAQRLQIIIIPLSLLFEGVNFQDLYDVNGNAKYKTKTLKKK